MPLHRRIEETGPLGFHGFVGPGTAIGVTADIAAPEQVTAAVEQVTSELGAPQIVIGQTLFTRPGDFDDITDPEVYVDSFRAYTMSTVYLLKAVLPAMKAAGWGRFVHVGSATAKEPEGAIQIVYLCSELAGYVNGAWIEVDGAHHRSAF